MFYDTYYLHPIDTEIEKFLKSSIQNVQYGMRCRIYIISPYKLASLLNKISQITKIMIPIEIIHILQSTIRPMSLTASELRDVVYSYVLR